jgi:hypothetical protein
LSTRLPVGIGEQGLAPENWPGLVDEFRRSGMYVIDTDGQVG